MNHALYADRSRAINISKQALQYKSRLKGKRIFTGLKRLEEKRTMCTSKGSMKQTKSFVPEPFSLKPLRAKFGPSNQPFKRIKEVSSCWAQQESEATILSKECIQQLVALPLKDGKYRMNVQVTRALSAIDPKLNLAYPISKRKNLLQAQNFSVQAELIFNPTVDSGELDVTVSPAKAYEYNRLISFAAIVLNYPQTIAVFGFFAFATSVYCSNGTAEVSYQMGPCTVTFDVKEFFTHFTSTERLGE